MNFETPQRFVASGLLPALALAVLAAGAVPPVLAGPSGAPAPAAISPKERLGAFETVALRMQKLTAGELAGGPPAGAAGRGHPLAQVVTANLAGSPAPADTMSLEALTDVLLPLTWRMSPSFPDTTFEWIEKGLMLARGCYRLGLAGDAVEWLQTIDRNARVARHRAEARRLLIRHYTQTSDSTGLDRLWDSWDADCGRGAAGRRATLAVLTALYLDGDAEALATAARRYVRFATHCKFFLAHLHFAAGNRVRANELAAELLWIFSKDTRGAYPPPMKLAVLLLAADIDWTTGMDGRAGREYGLLASIDHPFAAVWSEFMLASIAMHNEDYPSAVERFTKMCASGAVPMWRSLACTLEEHSRKMIEWRGDR